jgi:uncharacterized protein YjbI with pentapeptide repeats
MEEHPESGEVMADRELVGDVKIAPLEVFERVRFVGVVFDGDEISGAKFVECEFEDCEFTETYVDAASEKDAAKIGMDPSEWIGRTGVRLHEVWDEADPSPELWTWFVDCKLTSCRFRQSSLTNVFFDGGAIKDSFFVETELDVVKFRFFSLEKVLFEECSVFLVDFINSDFDHCRFLGSSLLGCNFDGEMICESAFVKSELELCTFTFVQLINTTFERCRTRGITVDDVIAMKSIQISEDESDEESIDLPDFMAAAVVGEKRSVLGVTLEPGARFESMTIAGADFSHADLRGATFVDCVLEGCNFTGANLAPVEEGDFDDSGRALIAPGEPARRADFRRSMISGCNFERASLGQVTFHDGKIIGSSFRDADLSQGELQSMELIGCDLSETKLDETIVEDCSIQEA